MRIACTREDGLAHDRPALALYRQGKNVARQQANDLSCPTTAAWILVDPWWSVTIAILRNGKDHRDRAKHVIGSGPGRGARGSALSYVSQMESGTRCEGRSLAVKGSRAREADVLQTRPQGLPADNRESSFSPSSHVKRSAVSLAFVPDHDEMNRMTSSHGWRGGKGAHFR